MLPLLIPLIVVFVAVTVAVPATIPAALSADQIPDYDNPYAPISTDKPVYTWTDKIKMTIVAPSWNTNDYLTDSIGDFDGNHINIATSKNSLKAYRFTETAPDSGIFTAQVTLTGFPHDADGDGNIDTTPRTGGTGPNNGFLEVGSDSGVTISFEFADDVILTESVKTSWNVGTVEFIDGMVVPDIPALVRVIDADMNLNPESLDTVPVHLHSDSDVAGIIVDAVETSESSGIFVASIRTSEKLPSSGNRLYALYGDAVSAQYADFTLPKPYQVSENLKIESSSKMESSVLPIDRLESSSIVMSNGFGNPVELPSSPDTQLQMVGTVTNHNDFKQPFVYVFQVKSPDGSVEFLSWVQTEILPQQSLDISQSWTPRESGVYTVESFVWRSTTDYLTLAPLTSTLVAIN